MGNPANVAGMARFGINPANTLGISIPALRGVAKEIGTNHALARALSKSGVHEARILAGFIDDPARVTEEQLERWVADFDSWDVCDQVCSNFFDRTPYAFTKAREWTGRNEEFIKRAGFVLMAALAVRDKQAADREFERFLPDHQARSPRHTELRQEGRQLGAPAYRQAQLHAQPKGHRDRQSHPSD